MSEQNEREGSDVSYELAKGKHDRPEDGRCAMEWVSFLAGEPHSDWPVCVSPVLKAFCVVFNDALPDGKRQRMRPFLARTIGTAGDGFDEQRAWMATDWLIRTYTPTWLELAALDDAAGRLRSLPPVLAVENLTRAMDDLSSARREAAAAGAAARAAVWAAVWDAAGAAAGAAARAAAGAAVGAAVWAAAGAAARAAAGDALAPTVDALQDSAFGLLERMVGLGDEVVVLGPVARVEFERLCAA